MHHQSETQFRIKKITRKNQIFKLESGEFKKGTIDRNKISSQFLHNTRKIDVYLPASYHKDSKRFYPTLIMHDGNNLFFPEESFAGVTWEVDKTLDILISKGLIEEIIVVAVSNTDQRSFEYAWSKMTFKNGLSEGGGGELYGKFLTKEVLPWLKENYRVDLNPETTGVMGSSFGGLISLYLGIHHSDTFKKLGIISPSLWWNYGEPMKEVEKLSNDLDVWLDMGTREGYHLNRESNYFIQSTRFLLDKLFRMGYKIGDNLAYFEDRGAKHDEASWANRLHLILMFLYGTDKSLIFKQI